MRVTRTLAAVAAALTLTLTGCGGGGDDGGSDGGSSTLNLGAALPPATQVAANAAWSNESIYYQAVYDTLLRETPDQQVAPSLATEWSYNKDNTVLTLKLRTDVKFTDGTPFTAEVAAENVERFRDGTSPNKATAAFIKDATAVDASTLKITLTEPDPSLLFGLSQAAGLQAAPSSFDAPDAQTNPVGTGPYVLDQTQTIVGSKYVYRKNDGYWAPEEQHYDQIVVTVYQSPSAIRNAMSAGQVDGTQLTPGTTAPEVEKLGFVPLGAEGGFAGLLLMDRQGALNPALAKVEVRQAINMAFDREKLLNLNGSTEGSLTTQIFSPTLDAYDPALDDRYPYDPERAKALLAEAGYPNGFTLELPQITGIPVNIYDAANEYLKAIGITVKPVVVAPNEVIPSIIGAKFPAAVFILGFLPTDFGMMQGAISNEATFNVFKVPDAKVTELLKVVQTGSPAAAAKAAKEINAYVVDQAWFAPWFRSAAPGFAVAEDVDVEIQIDNAYPYLWNFKPKA